MKTLEKEERYLIDSDIVLRIIEIDVKTLTLNAIDYFENHKV